MSCSLLSSQLRHSSKFPCRAFRSTPRRAFASSVDDVASHAFAFHHLFESVHEFTGLPWLYSIPLVTWLFRFSLLPSRFHYAFRRRDQRLAGYELSFHSKVIDRQWAMKKRAKAMTDDELQEWVVKTWEYRRRIVHEKFKRAEPNALMSHETNFDITNVGVWALTAMNISTLFKLDLSAAELSQLSMYVSEGPSFVVSWVCFAYLAFLNTEYYHGNPSSRVTHGPQATFSENLNPFQWEWTYVPVAAYTCLFFCPIPVTMFALSNTAYTVFERKLVDLVVDVPAINSAKGPLRAVQTRRKTLRSTLL